MSNHKAHPLGGKLVSWPVLVLAPFAVLCGMLILKRLFFGLGSVTDLNGGYPWGLWISFDLLIGTGFACGGWALAWAVCTAWASPTKPPPGCATRWTLLPNCAKPRTPAKCPLAPRWWWWVAA